MPNTFIDNRDRWMSLSEIDYLGQFVKVWLAFNAWYRSAYTATSDRAIINEFKWQPNPVLNKLRPLLTNTTEEAEQFRAEIGLLHHRLENYEVHHGKGAEKQRITLTNVYLKDNPPSQKTGSSWGFNFTVDRQPNQSIRTEVRNRTNSVIFQHQQARFNLTDLENQPTFQSNLTPNLQSFLRQLYLQITPQLYANLTSGSNAAIKCGAYDLKCGSNDLFAGTVEAVYLMRCTLFHGELVPTKEASGCYEPAYRIVRRIIESVS